jgi:uncharacterized protein YndB with AHSA1/START domain
VNTISEYDWSCFDISMYYLRPRSEVFTTWATSSGLESFFIANARHVSANGAERSPDEIAEPGDTYDWRHLQGFEHSGTFTAVRSDELLAFTFGPMMVEITFRDEDFGTDVHLTQTGCATSDPERVAQHLNCHGCWIYFMTNLRAVLHNGIDLRDHDHPTLNDSISVGWNRSTLTRSDQ